MKVARGKQRTFPIPPSDPDTFLDLRFAKLRHHIVAFPHPKDVYTLTYKIYTDLSPLNMATSTLREALALTLATSDRRLLHNEIAKDIIDLSDLLR